MASSETDIRLDAIIAEVLSIPREDRADYLTKACRGNNELRRKAELLLQGIEGDIPDNFLNDPITLLPYTEIVNSLTTLKSIEPGDRIGVHRVIKMIGKGGMGEVYLARRDDGQIDRRVAIKVVRGGFGSDEALERFKYERQILANLTHPNIATVYDVGITNDGFPYLAMEYLEGLPLDTFCDNNNLSIEDRLKYFKTVCDAVQHAQNNLVIHRDLKPSNILVTGKGIVKLLDFGIAKLLEDETRQPNDSALSNGNASKEPTIPIPNAQLTHKHAPFTPAYAAPEQIDGLSVNTATDVYALGVILYKLLTGSRPYSVEERKDSVSLAEVVWGSIPQPPSDQFSTQTRLSEKNRQRFISEQRGELSSKLLRRKLRGDLDAITLKAIEKHPEDRYQSAGELGRDIQRYLDRRPIRARPDNVGIQLGKFIQRHRTTVIASFIGFLILIAGVGTTIREAQLRMIETQNRELEEHSKEATISMIESILDLVDPDMPEGYNFTVRQILDAGLEVLETWDSQPLVQAELLNEFGRVVLNAGMIDVADSLHQRALTLQTENLDANHPDLAESYLRIAEVYDHRENSDQAGFYFLKAITLDPNNAIARNNLGVFYADQGKLPEAINEFEIAIQADPSYVKAYRNLAAMYFYVEDWTKAKESLRITIENEPHYNAYSTLASILYFIDKDYQAAADLYGEALKINDHDYDTWAFLGSALHWTQQFEDSSKVTFKKAISLANEHLLTVDSTNVAAHAQLAVLYSLTDEPSKAYAHIEKALIDSLTDDYVSYNIGYTYEILGDRNKAVYYLDKALNLGYHPIYLENEPALKELLISDEYLRLNTQ